MAVVLRMVQAHQYTGLAADTKPTDATVLPGAQFLEVDTGRTFVWDGLAWSAVVGPMTPSTAAVGTPQLSADRELLAAINTLTEAFREFTYVFLQQTGP